MARKQNKAAFVLRHATKDPTEILKLAAASGVKLSQSTVYRVLKDKFPGHTHRPAARAPKLARTQPPAAAPKPARKAAPGVPIAVQLTQLITRVGTEAARDWLDALDAEPMGAH